MHLSGAALTVEAAYVTYAPNVLGFAITLEQDLDLAQDFASETWARATEKWHTFDGRNLMGWLCRILHNLAADHHRSRHSQHISLETYLEDNASDPWGVGSIHSQPDPAVRLPAELVIDDEDELDYITRACDSAVLRDALSCALAQLSPDLRNALDCRTRGLSGSEAALVLSISETNYRQRLFKARRQVISMLSLNATVEMHECSNGHASTNGSNGQHSNGHQYSNGNGHRPSMLDVKNSQCSRPVPIKDD